MERVLFILQSLSSKGEKMKKLIGLFNSLIKYFQEKSQKAEADVLIGKFIESIDEAIEEINIEKIRCNNDRMGLNFESIYDEAIQAKLIAEKTAFDRLVGNRGKIIELKEKAKEVYADYVPGDIAVFKDKMSGLSHLLIKRKVKAYAKLYEMNRLIASAERISSCKQKTP